MTIVLINLDEALIAAIAAGNAISFLPPTAPQLPDMAFEEQTCSSSPDINSTSSTRDTNGVSNTTEPQAESLRDKYDKLRDKYDELRDENDRLKDSYHEIEKQHMEKCHWLEQRIIALEAKLNFKRLLWQTETQKLSEKVRKLNLELGYTNGVQDPHEDGGLEDDELVVDITIAIRERGGNEPSLRRCKLDTGCPELNLIARSVLQGLNPDKRDYNGAPVVGLGGKGITPKEEVELEWHVRGKPHQEYTDWFTVWEEEHEGNEVSLGVDVLIGRKTLAERHFLSRNRNVYLGLHAPM